MWAGLPNNHINHKVFSIFLYLVVTDFSYSAQIMLENALLCRRNVHLKNRLFCSKFCPQNLSKPTYVVTRQNTRIFKAAVVLPLSETTHLFIAFQFTVDTDKNASFDYQCAVLRKYQICILKLVLFVSYFHNLSSDSDSHSETRCVRFKYMYSTNQLRVLKNEYYR